jgi:hypothetical protein
MKFRARCRRRLVTFTMDVADRLSRGKEEKKEGLK